jgi:hypothetical protein
MKKNNARKRPYKKRNALYKIPKQMGAFSNYQIVNLRYGDQFTLDSTAVGTYGSYHFRANSCFDPDETSIGHQPRGFDQWAAFYDNYIVLGSKITLYGNNTLQALEAGDTTHSKFNMAYLVLSLTEDKPLVAKDIPEMLESRLHSYKALNTNQNNTVKLVKKFSAKKFLGIKIPSDASQLTAVCTTNPTQEVWFNVNAFNGSTSVEASASLHCTFVIDYIVMFKNRKVLPQS